MLRNVADQVQQLGHLSSVTHCGGVSHHALYNTMCWQPVARYVSRTSQSHITTIMIAETSQHNINTSHCHTWHQHALTIYFDYHTHTRGQHYRSELMTHICLVSHTAHIRQWQHIHPNTSIHAIWSKCVIHTTHLHTLSIGTHTSTRVWCTHHSAHQCNMTEHNHHVCNIWVLTDVYAKSMYLHTHTFRSFGNVMLIYTQVWLQCCWFMCIVYNTILGVVCSQLGTHAFMFVRLVIVHIWCVVSHILTTPYWCQCCDATHDCVLHVLF